MKHVLILGGTGFLGQNLAQYLGNRGYQIGILGRSMFPERKNGDFKFYLSTLKDISNFNELVCGYDCIVHMVSASIPGKTIPLLDLSEVIEPTIRLLDACVKQCIPKIIFFSSGGTVYGIPKSIPIKEDSSLCPISSYGVHKVALEKYFQFYSYSYGLNVQILRLSNPYGRYQKPFARQGLIATILGHYFLGEPIEIWGDGGDVRDYIYIDDVITAIEKTILYDGKECIFNIGAGKGYSVNQVISVIQDILGTPLMCKKVEARKQDVPCNILDIGKARRELQWRPNTSLENGITKMISCWNMKTHGFE